MSIFSRIKALIFKSAQIKMAIEAEQRRRAPDIFRLLELKKKRLELQNQLARLVKYAGRVPAVAQRQARSGRIQHKHKIHSAL